MFTLKECTHITRHDFRPENHMDSGLLTCNMGHLLKVGSGETMGGCKTDKKVRDRDIKN